MILGILTGAVIYFVLKNLNKINWIKFIAVCILSYSIILGFSIFIIFEHISISLLNISDESLQYFLANFWLYSFFIIPIILLNLNNNRLLFIYKLYRSKKMKN